MKIDPKHDLFEFHFHYHIEDPLVSQISTFWLMILMKPKKCLIMHVASGILCLVGKVEKWNRWADRWEEVDLPTSDPSLN